MNKSTARYRHRPEKRLIHARELYFAFTFPMFKRTTEDFKFSGKSSPRGIPSAARFQPRCANNIMGSQDLATSACLQPWPRTSRRRGMVSALCLTLSPSPSPSLAFDRECKLTMNLKPGRLSRDIDWRANHETWHLLFSDFKLPMTLPEPLMSRVRPRQ